MELYDIEKFYPKIWKTGDSYVITIPRQMMEGAGFEVGEKIVAFIRKRLPEEIKDSGIDTHNIDAEKTKENA